MSVAELKVQADALSSSEVSELSHYLRGLALRKNPARQAQLKTALQSSNWVAQEELEQAVNELEHRSQ